MQDMTHTLVNMAVTLMLASGCLLGVCLYFQHFHPAPNPDAKKPIKPTRVDF